MKKCLIIFTIVLVSIIPTLKVKAVVYDDTDFPTIVSDGNSDYIIFENVYGTQNFGFGTWLVTYNVENLGYIALYNNYSNDDFPTLSFYLDDTTNNYSSISYNAYKLENNQWVLTYTRENTTSSGNKNVVGLKKIYYSTQNVYAKKNSPGINTAHNSTGGVCYGVRRLSNCSNYDSDITITPGNTTNTIVYNAPVVNVDYIKYDLEKMFSDYGSYYIIKIYTTNYNENYTYKYKFDFQNEFNDISSYLDNEGYFAYTLLNNGTLYLAVYDENNDLIDSETFTFSDITYSLEKPTPSVSINVNYSVDSDNLASAKITFNFNNYSPNYSYYYSFNDIEDIYISDEDIIDNKFSITTYQNCVIYFYIYNSDGVPIYRTTKRITDIIDNGGYFYYTFDMSDFYNSDNNSIKTLVFYYENQKLLFNNERLLPYFNFYLLGEDNQLLPFYIKYNKEIIDINVFTRNVNFDGLVSSYLPKEFKFNDTNYNYKSYTVFAIAPVMNLTDYIFDDYNDYKLVIRTTKELYQGNFSFRDNVVIPLPDINNDLKDYNEQYSFISSLFDKFLQPIKNTFPVFWQIYDLIQSLDFENGEGDLPPITIDLSFLGINKVVSVIDFSIFIDYKSYLWGVYKMFIGFWTLRNVSRNIKFGS